MICSLSFQYFFLPSNLVVVTKLLLLLVKKVITLDMETLYVMNVLLVTTVQLLVYRLQYHVNRATMLTLQKVPRVLCVVQDIHAKIRRNLPSNVQYRVQVVCTIMELVQIVLRAHQASSRFFKYL